MFICQQCYGDGKIPINGKLVDCSACDGKGKGELGWTCCPTCKGSGEEISSGNRKRICSFCKGRRLIFI